jgi:hypothetical protein
MAPIFRVEEYKKQEIRMKQTARTASCCFLLGLLFNPEHEHDVPPKHQLTFSGQQCITSKKTEFFKIQKCLKILCDKTG